MVTIVGNEITIDALLFDIVELDYDEVSSLYAAIRRLNSMAFSLIRTAMKGTEALARETAAQSQRASQLAAQSLRAFGDVRSPQELLSAQSDYLKSSTEALLEQTARTHDIAESTRKTLIDDCSSHLQDSLVAYTRLVRT